MLDLNAPTFTPSQAEAERDREAAVKTFLAWVGTQVPEGFKGCHRESAACKPSVLLE